MEVPSWALVGALAFLSHVLGTLCINYVVARFAHDKPAPPQKMADAARELELEAKRGTRHTAQLVARVQELRATGLGDAQVALLCAPCVCRRGAQTQK